MAEGPLNLFVGGFARGTVLEADLLQAVQPHGTVTAVHFKGTYAFIYFQNEEEVVSAAAALDGCYLLGNRISARGQRRGDAGGKTQERYQPVKNCMFVGGLKAPHDESYLRSTFEPFGTIKRVILKRGFGFVHFDAHESLVAALDYYKGNPQFPFTIREQTDDVRGLTTKQRHHDEQGVMIPVVPQPEKPVASKRKEVVSMVSISGFGDTDPDDVVEAVTDLCSAYGEATDITVAPNVVTVVFGDSTVAERMVSDFANGSDWMDKALSFSLVSSVVSTKVAETDVHLLKIGPEVTRRDIEVVFGLFGTVKDIVISAARDAVITFTTRAARKNAITFLPGRNLGGHPMAFLDSYSKKRIKKQQSQQAQQAQQAQLPPGHQQPHQQVHPGHQAVHQQVHPGHQQGFGKAKVVGHVPVVHAMPPPVAAAMPPLVAAGRQAGDVSHGLRQAMTMGMMNTRSNPY